jgi:two-component system cell cycle response regulator DivK
MALETEKLAKEARPRSAPGIAVPPKRILLVDDYPDALEIWELYLGSLGYDVVTADDGPKALDRAHAQRPDVIVLDLELPGITGFEVARRLRGAAETAAIPLIAATGYSHVPQLDEAREAGFDSIVIKPCEPEALVAEIERLLGQAPGSAQSPQMAPVKRLSHKEYPLDTVEPPARTGDCDGAESQANRLQKDELE